MAESLPGSYKEVSFMDLQMCACVRESAEQQVLENYCCSSVQCQFIFCMPLAIELRVVARCFIL